VIHQKKAIHQEGRRQKRKFNLIRIHFAISDLIFVLEPNLTLSAASSANKMMSQP